MGLDGQYKIFLFSKHILVCDVPSNNEKKSNKTHSMEDFIKIARSRHYASETILSLAKLFNIRITSGGELAQPQLLTFVSLMMGERVPDPFYIGFPHSVRDLNFAQLSMDQALSYVVTYGMGDFSKARHSVFENDKAVRRAVFKEEGSVKDFIIISQQEAEKRICAYVKDMLLSTRPLNDASMKIAVQCIRDFGLQAVTETIASKTNVVRLFLELESVHLLRFLMLSDVIKLVEEIQFRQMSESMDCYLPRRNYREGVHKYDTVDARFDLRYLHLPNQKRKLIEFVIDQCFQEGRVDLYTCYEKKKIWNGLLHHIHYKPKCQEAKAFVTAMRGKGNFSVYSEFEREFSKNGAVAAAEFLLSEKGSGALLRNLNYLSSRCGSEEELRKLLEVVFAREKMNSVILMQLLLMYGNYERAGRLGRTFQFVKCNLLRVHGETKKEEEKRRSLLAPWVVSMLKLEVEKKLRETLCGRLPKVYIHPEMKNYAVPLKESASQGGFGVLPSGTSLEIREGKKIRAFTYWEKVDDIDLSVIGLTEEGRQSEFSWRTMAKNQSEAITYSGDQTSGYHGGSEYFDIIVPEFRRVYPEIRYLVFCDNVFSYLNFDQCVCRAGYMVRDEKDSGEVFEPKTVHSSFTVNAPARFAYLFGIDLEKNSFIWINCVRDDSVAVAGTTPMKFLIEKFHITETLNLYTLFSLMAQEIVNTPKEADVIVAPSSSGIKISEGQEIIYEYDFERITALIH